ncbi:hypothetical protein NLJ89_g5056 [Agrocybe chaxingu]|uniref:DASH complex subunit DAM1 n=1 Tax=Agrocybe chaxingu TaxID=84603 RepID=A0A9W8K0X1_9AGAR|nr:hypothetical protein NLJ89_g5056 [Agrocybe chaxingu]
MAELLDETDALQTNIAGMKNLSDSLATFNESFASWLHASFSFCDHAMRVDAVAYQAPTPLSFQRARQRAEEDALTALEALQAKNAAKAREIEIAAAIGATDKTTATDADTTYAANVTNATGGASNKSTGIPKKKVGKAKLTAKEKKERSMEIEKIILCLPLEFRGSDPGLRRNMEMVIEGLMYSTVPGLKLTDLITPPDLNQARVNKCLIALVNRKVVQKDNSTGTVLYRWKGIP